MKMIEDGRAADIDLKESEMRKLTFPVGDTDGFGYYPISIASINKSASFTEPRKLIRITFRSH